MSERTVDLPPLVRALVAVLAAHAGRSVSVDRLADALWDGRPPPSFRNRVQAAVSTLRRSLAAVGVTEQLVLTTPSGYALDLDQSIVDALQFVALLAAAREHLASGEPVPAIHTYRNALALWRGDAFDGVTRAGIEAEAARLDELRLGVVEECIEAELATGQHANAVVELTRLLAQHPLRERLRGQLMLGLYRSGREAEALAVYRSGYDRVTAELGVEPGADLQALHHAILTRQPRLLSSPGPATAAFADDYLVPSQMPMSVPDFTGRQAEMTALQAHLATRVDGTAAPPVVVVIAGMGGVGKTTLAVRAGRRAPGAFPGGGLFADLRGTTNEPADPHDVLGSFLRALGVQAQRVPTDPAERIGLYRSMTATRRVLVVLDDAATESQVRPLIPAGDGCAAIVTARSLLLGLEGAVWIQLDALPHNDAVELLAAVAGRDRVSDLDLAEQVVRLCGGLPLAVRIAAARLGGQRLLTLPQLVAGLSDEDSCLDVLSAGDRSVRACLSLSYGRLDAGAARLLRLLGTVPGPDFTVRTCAVVLDEPLAGASRTLDRLLAAQLVALSESRSEPRYRLHDLVRHFAAERAAEEESERARESPLIRLLDHYIDTAYAAGNLMTGGRNEHLLEQELKPAEPLRFETDAEAIDWFAGEKAVLRSAVMAAAGLGLHAQAWQLAHGLRALYRRLFELDDWLAVQQVALTAAQALDDPPAIARVRESLGSVYLELGRAAEARDQWTTTLALLEELGDEIGVGRCHDSLGVAYGRLGQLELSIFHHGAALAIPVYAAHPQFAAWSQHNLGVRYGQAGQHHLARKAFQRALEVASRFGDTELICLAEHNLAEVYLLTGDNEKAQAHARAEIDIAERVHYRLREARGWDILGLCLIDVDRARAHAAWRRAFELYESLRHPLAESVRARLSSPV